MRTPTLQWASTAPALEVAFTILPEKCCFQNAYSLQPNSCSLCRIATHSRSSNASLKSTKIPKTYLLVVASTHCRTCIHEPSLLFLAWNPNCQSEIPLSSVSSIRVTTLYARVPFQIPTANKYFFYNFGTNTRNRARPRTYSKLWSE